MTALSHLLPITDQLRNYGWTGQWGLEKTYQEYLDKMILFMSECKRVLKKTGTIWINLGDSYNGFKVGNTNGTYGQVKQKEGLNNGNMVKLESVTIPVKSLMLIPHRFAIRCCDELKLILRNDIIWAKRNGMPESVTDRFSKKHEFIFFFVKSQKYYFDLDAVRDKHLWANTDKRSQVQGGVKSKGKCETGLYATDKVAYHELGKNPGDVADFWDIVTKGSNEKHFAKFNSELIDKPIIAGCPENGVILDPFAGTGETPVRAAELGRKYIAIDGKPEYCKIMERRLASIPEYMFSNNK